jgi:hypothetical protein
LFVNEVTSVGNPSEGSNIEDQRENYRREQEASRIASLPTNEQQAAMIVENARKQLYDDANQGMYRPCSLCSELIVLNRIKDAGCQHRPGTVWCIHKHVEMCLSRVQCTAF